MDFRNEIIKLENSNLDNTYIMRIGKVPVILTAVHTMVQQKSDGIKYNEPFTKAIAEYVSNKVDSSYYIKLKDTGIDSNSLVIDEFKNELLKIIKENNIKLLIDLHGASKDRNFDVEFGTLNNLSVDYTAVKELEDAFNENGIKNVEYNNPFKGGGITRYIYGETDIDIIQIEINKKFRNVDNIDETHKICDALIDFIKMYTNFN